MMLSITDDTFRREVLETTGEPVFVHFWAPWCKLCRSVEPTLEQFRDQFGYPLRLVSVNADENLKLVSTYRIKTLPTLLCFADGTLIGRVEGFPGREELRRTLHDLGARILPTVV